MEIEQRDFRADPAKLKRLRVAAGLTIREVVEATDLDRGTVAKIFRGDPVFLKSLALVVRTVFQISNPLDVLHPEELSAMGATTEIAGPDQVMEWTVERHVTGWQQTSNGLQYQVAQLCHRYLRGRRARGKCYELRHLTDADRRRSEKYLLRHVEVCETLGEHRNIAHNLTAAPVAGQWWVLDRWEDGETLANRLEGGRLGDYELRMIMTGIADGLAELHRHKIIRRELSPRSILLRESNDCPVLTDMELAKLGAGNPTVAPDEWPPDPYRALEVCSDGTFDERVDLFSWGRIFVRAAAGALCEIGEEDLETVDLPHAVRDIVLRCVSPHRSGRPSDMKTVLKVLKGWA